MTEFSVQVMSDVDYEDLIAEIQIGEDFWCVVSQENGFDDLKVEILPSKHELKQVVQFSVLISALEAAKARLWDLRKTNQTE